MYICYDMIKPFKFFVGILDHYNRSVNPDLYTTFRIGQDEPPFNLSRRHWNILPQDLRGATLQEMECYIQGWEGAHNNIALNPYDDIIRRELWNRGYLTFRERIRRED
jgi:hypothetical protein